MNRSLPVAPSKRTRFQFTLRTAFLIITAISVVLAIVGRDMHRRYLSWTAVERLRDAGAVVQVRVPGRKYRPGWLDEKWFQVPDSVSIMNRPVALEDLRALQQLSGLRILRLEHASVTDDAIEYAKRLTNLEILTMAQTRITAEGLLQLPSLRRLKLIELNEAQLAPEVVKRLQAESELETVILRADIVSVEHIAALNRLPQLDSLFIYFDSMVDGTPQAIGQLKNLNQLFLHGAEWSGGGWCDFVPPKTLRILQIIVPSPGTPGKCPDSEIIAVIRRSLPRLCELRVCGQDILPEQDERALHAPNSDVKTAPP